MQKPIERYEVTCLASFSWLEMLHGPVYFVLLSTFYIIVCFPVRKVFPYKKVFFFYW